MSRTYQKLPFFSALHGSGCRHQRLAAARRDGGRVKRSRRFCYLAKSPTLLTPEEASSLAVQSQPSAKKATDNHSHIDYLVTLFNGTGGPASGSYAAPVYSE